MRILKIAGDVDIKLDVPDDAEVVDVAIDEYLVYDFEEKFDLIFCTHALQSLWATELSEAFKKLVDDLAHMGELHIHVPAIEPAVKSIIKNVVDPLAFYVLWGTRGRPFHSGFTLEWLRATVEAAGGLVRSANMGMFRLQREDEVIDAIEHVVIATVIRE